MPNQTPNYNLTKPLQSENYNVDVFNNNSDIIDTSLKLIDTKTVNNSQAIANKIDNTKIINNLLATESGFVLDARQGKIINDRLVLIEGVPSGALTVSALKDINKNIKIAFSGGNNIYSDYPPSLASESLVYGILTVTVIESYRTFEIIATNNAETKVKKMSGFGSLGKEIKWE